MFRLNNITSRPCGRGKAWSAFAIAAVVSLLPGSVQATGPGEVAKDGQFFLGQPGAPYTVYQKGTKVGGWDVTGGNVKFAVDYFSTPNNNSYSVDLNGTTSGQISQVLKTVIGETYTITFLMSGNWTTNAGQRKLTVACGSIAEVLAMAQPTGWSRTNMIWKTCTYQFKATSTETTLKFTSGTAGVSGPVIAAVSVRAPMKPPGALDSIPVPVPPDIDQYVMDRQAAIILGKALFWDMQAGGDGKTACATCHWHAGTDARTTNTVHPGAPGSAFGHQTADGPALAADALAHFRGPNKALNANDFPFHRLQDMDHPESGDNPVIFDTKEVVGAQGVVKKKFTSIVPENPVDVGQNMIDDIFNVGGANVRQVTGRNSPTNINAIFFDRSFWDGRANRYFNGVNPFGDLDPDARVLQLVTSTVTVPGPTPKSKPTYTTVTKLEPVHVLIDNGTLASQAVGPANNAVEMSWDGRMFPELGRKMLSLTPLSLQEVAADDSVLGTVRSKSGRGLDAKNAGYAKLIRAAFQPQWWAGTTTTPDGYTHMEANFAFYWGIAIQCYEATLVSDKTPYDDFRHGKADALSVAAKRGLEIFLNEGKCINCHAGPEFAGGTISNLRGVLGNDGPVEFMAMAEGIAFYDSGFYNIGVRQTNEDISVGASHPQFGPLSYSRQKQNGRDIGQSITVPQGARIAVNGAFKTPSLRNVELTGPYFHNGGEKDLLGVVKFYTRGADFRSTNIRDLDPDVEGIPQLQGNIADQLALVEFLKHLTDERVRRNAAPFDHPEIVIPNGHGRTVVDGVLVDNNVIIPATGSTGGPPILPFADILQ